MELVKGQLVRSRRGRDVEKLYVVLKANEERALLCDGDKKTLAQPKPKNPRHLQPINTRLPDEDMQTDLKIKTALRAYEAEHRRTQQGG